jgi:lipopolysaccharide biosynthesis glycosyltransferase
MKVIDSHDIQPAFSWNNTPIVLSSDEGYALHAGVVVKSIIDSSSPEKNYDIIIFDGGISDISKRHVLSLADARENISLRFIDIDHFLRKFDSNIFKLNVTAHFTKVTFYRLFIPEILRNYTRVVYLDCDLVVKTDIAELYNIDLDGKLLGAAKDYGMEIIRAEFSSFYSNYLESTLALRAPSSYFNAGVLVFDIKRSLERDLTRRCIEKLVEIERPVFADQCVLNSVCQDDFHCIKLSWNFTVNNLLLKKAALFDLPGDTYLKIMEAYRAPDIIHYSSEAKPWFDTFCKYEFAQYWWDCACSAGFQGIFLGRMRKESTAEAAIDREGVNSGSRRTKVYLFGIPILKLIVSENQTKALLFGFFPIFRIRNF